MTLTYISPTGTAPLYEKYPSQINAQPAFLQLNPESKTVSFGITYTPGPPYGTPMEVFHGHVLRWHVHNELTVRGCDDLVADLMPLLERIVAGHEVVWNGSNHVGRLNNDATDANESVDQFCEQASETYDCVDVWPVGTWLLPDSDKVSARTLGLTTESTDDDLRRIAAACEKEAAGDGITLDGDVYDELEALRDRLRQTKPV